MRWLLPFLLAGALLSLDLDVYGFGLSHHYSWVGTGEPRQWNPGIGVGLSEYAGNGLGLTAVALTYTDSYDERAKAYGAGAVYRLGSSDSIHASTKLIVARLCGSGVDGYTVIPTVGLGYRWLAVEGTYNPQEDVVCSWIVLSFHIR